MFLRQEWCDAEQSDPGCMLWNKISKLAVHVLDQNIDVPLGLNYSSDFHSLAYSY